MTWTTSAENLIAGMQYLGQWEERVEDVIAELQSIHGLLHVSSLVDLVRLGGSQPGNSLAAFLMPYMRRGELRLIAASLIIQAARNHRLDFEQTAAGTASRLFAQFMPYQAPPRGVVQLVNDVIEQAITDRQTNDAGITTKMVVDQLTKLTGLPASMLRDSETLTPQALKDEFRSHVIGQASAVEAVTNVVLRWKAGLCDPRRPVATMLFCGPTGVGKTQLARSLADYLFGHAESNQKPLVRLDMSEYGSWDAVDRFLIGSDGEVAPCIGRLRANPMSVLLFDEFEKSSPEVHDCLLSALDEGRLTDRFGRTTTLCGAIVILPSNVGSRSSSSIGFGEDDSSAMRRAIEREFRPEFLNRLDETVIFEPLPSSMIELIVQKDLESLANREALVARRVQLRWDDTIIKKLAAVGFDPLLGARPLQRAIDREVVAKIARQLLESDRQSGPTEIDLAQLL